MTKTNLERNLIIYETPAIEIKTVERAREEVAFLRKAHSLGLFNKMIYDSGSGLIQGRVNSSRLDHFLSQILADAELGKLPGRYSIGLNVGFDGANVNTRIYDRQ